MSTQKTCKRYSYAVLYSFAMLYMHHLHGSETGTAPDLTALTS